MTVTAQDILTSLGYSAWSGFNIDDMVFTSEDSAQAREEMNRALRFLINIEDFPFKNSEKNLMIIEGIEKYSAPYGQIEKIYNTDTLKELKFIADSSGKDKTITGAPSAYWIDTKNPKENIRLYPIPDADMNLTIKFAQFMPVKQQDGIFKFEFTNADDYINIPSRLEYLFKDCLVLRTMQQNNKDEQDENYKPTISEFWEHWRVFLNACRTVKQNSRIVW